MASMILYNRGLKIINSAVDTKHTSKRSETWVTVSFARHDPYLNSLRIEEFILDHLFWMPAFAGMTKGRLLPHRHSRMLLAGIQRSKHLGQGSLKNAGFNP
jgi:hypothetical protein